ncbi:NACHT domain-containing protein [Streptomyces cinerochromogenes]|uniref:NACHT domain-containing protein n=1 Tax=Streptomyces cinerochromogenes TaxID=66422 RepID=UPI0033A6F109
MHFLPDCGIPKEKRSEIKWVLNHLAKGGGPGRLPEQVHRVEVVRLVTGGLSGAEVLEIRIRRGEPEAVEWHVAKLQEPSEARDEWSAYTKHMQELETAYRTAITAVSERILKAEAPLPGFREAVVYQHVSERIAEPGRAVATLEQLAGQALDGCADAERSALRGVGLLVRRLRESLSRTARPHPLELTLQQFSRGLGPDLVVEIDSVAARGASPSLVFPEDVFAASWAEDGEEQDPRFRVGEWITVPWEADKHDDETELIELDEYTTMKVRGAAQESRPLKPELLDVKVVGTRVQRYWGLAEELLGDDLARDPHGVRLGDCRFGPPFGHLPAILCDTARGWVCATVHGDLNPRNVLVADDQPYLIDHARAKGDRPLLSDPAWLEMNLLRNVVAPRLDWCDLVRLNRLLAVACRLGPSAGDGDGDMSRWSWAWEGESERFGVAFRLLWQVRVAAHHKYPQSDQRPWWREYLAQLSMAACRTLKWPREMHDRHSVVAALVASGVAGEHWGADGDGGPAACRHWPATDLNRLAIAVLPQIDPHDSQRRSLLLDIMRALDMHGSGRDRPRLAEVIRQARERTVRALCAEHAGRRLLAAGRRNRAFIPLHASAVTGDGGAVGGVGDSAEPREALSLIASYQAVALAGAAGAGKSTLLQELEYLYASAVTGERTDPPLPPRMPLRMHAAALTRALDEGFGSPGDVLARASEAGSQLGSATCGVLLSLGGLQLLVDGFDELPQRERPRVAEWLKRLRTHYPGTPLVVCHRTSAHRGATSAAMLRLPVIALHQVTAEQARRYAAARITTPARTPWDNLLFGLDHTGEAAGGAEGAGEVVLPQGMPELLGTPLFLWMAVEARIATGTAFRSVAALFHSFTVTYLTERHRRLSGTGTHETRFSFEDKAPLLEAVAEHLVEHGPVPPEHLEQRLGAIRRDWRAVLDEVFASEFLRVEHGLVKFRHELFQAYWAGRALARVAVAGDSALLGRVLTFEWQEPTRMLVGFADTDPETIERICRAAADADPRYGAWLLREAHTTAPETLEAFVNAQCRTLMTASAGPQSWNLAATALTLVRTPTAWSVLVKVITGDGAQAGAVLECLAAMGAALNHDARPRPDTVAATALRQAVTHLFDRTLPAEVEAAAVRAVGQAGLVALSAYLMERIRAGNPWPVVREAAAALTGLGVELTPLLRAARDEACRRRLTVADQEAREAPRASEAASLAQERADLLALLARSETPGALDVLLEHRFDPVLAELPSWSTLLAEAARARLARVPGDPVASLLVPGEADTSAGIRRRALRLFAEGSDTEALGAAHLLLSDAELPPRELLELVTPGSSAPRLLAAAAAVDSLGHAELGTAEKLIRGLIREPHPDEPQWLEALAALVGAVGQQSHLLRVRLVHAATRELQHRGVTQAMKGAWAHTFYHAEIDNETLTALLEQGEDDSIQVAMDFMSGVDFLLDAAGRPDPLQLSHAAEQRILARRPPLWPEGAGPSHRPVVPTDIVRYVQAAAYAGVPGATDFVKAVASSTTAAETLITLGHSRHGIVELAAGAHAITAVGWFGRLEGEQQRLESVREALAWLRGLDTGRHGHPSLERARLVGLGMLGIWRPLLLGLTPGDPILHDAAAHVVLGWLPVPWRTASPDDHPGIARWIRDRLQSEEVTSPEVRAVLFDILSRLSRHLGRYLGGPSQGSAEGDGA